MCHAADLEYICGHRAKALKRCPGYLTRTVLCATETLRHMQTTDALPRERATVSCGASFCCYDGMLWICCFCGAKTGKVICPDCDHVRCSGRRRSNGEFAFCVQLPEEYTMRIIARSVHDDSNGEGSVSSFKSVSSKTEGERESPRKGKNKKKDKGKNGRNGNVEADVATEPPTVAGHSNNGTTTAYRSTSEIQTNAFPADMGPELKLDTTTPGVKVEPNQSKKQNARIRFPPATPVVVTSTPK